MRIASGGMSWIVGCAIITCLFFISSILTSGWYYQFFLTILLAVFFIFLILLCIFFRDPDRMIGSGEVVAVADGKIQSITSLKDEDVGSCVRVVTFMNIYDVHVNRMPLTGTISKMQRHSGGHRPAFSKESEYNERVELLVKTDIGIVKIVQIAGAFARRIVSYVENGSEVKKGERIGLIRLGSRVDLYLPEKKQMKLLIKEGCRVKAGSDDVASFTTT